METLYLNLGEASESLSLLREMIHHQREALDNSEANETLKKQMARWEHILEQIEANANLADSTRLTKLYEVSQHLNATLDWEETIETVIDAVIEITGAERGMLVLQEENNLEIKVTRSADGMPFSSEDLHFSRSVVRSALRQERPLLTSNAQRDPRFQSSESVFAYGLRSILCAPLIYRGRALGVIYVENRAQTGTFSHDDLGILAAFANQAAVALVNARTYHQVDRALNRRVEELTLLQEMAQDLNGRLNFDRVMERSLTWAMAAVSADEGALGLMSNEGVQWVARSGEIEIDTQIAQHVTQFQTSHFSEQEICLPLIRERRAVGVFYLHADEPRFTEEQLNFVERLADNAVIAVENARLYEALRQANDTKSEFVSMVSHELRTPMTSIRGYAEMMQKGMAGEISEQQLQFIDAIHRNVQRMRILVNDLLDISRMETGRLKLEPEPTALADAVAAAHETVREMLERKQQRFTATLPEELPDVHADPDRLTQILINLLSNAVKYTPEGGAIAVRAVCDMRAARHPDQTALVQCAVQDTGIGINREDQQRLFTKFFRSSAPEVQEETGTGLGLAITKNLVELHGGELWVRSEKGEGTTFIFTLPAAD
jgi:signal transduction histidine kinase